MSDKFGSDAQPLNSVNYFFMAKRRPIAIPMLGFLVGLSGCVHELTQDVPDHSLVMIRFEAGWPVEQCTIENHSSAHLQLMAWIAKHRTGWSSTFATYVPKLMIEGPDFSINVLESSVVAQSGSGQIIHGIGPDEFQFLACQNGIKQ